jgi:4-amino-4-deoxy-L-arabinose transferase-like glycosyltransferase
MTVWRSESRISIVFVGASAAIFVLALVLVPPFGVTFDEAKYLGIGFSMVEGHGPQIVFGGYFLPHSPLWPTVVVAPAVAFGVDALVVGRSLNAISGLGLILLSAALAWRIRPAAAALAAIGLLATTYIHELTRTARLDVPAAALAVAYLALGLVAVRRGSARYAVAAGLLFGVAFLIKEIVLPLAPVPILAAILHRRPWRSILRTAGWILLSAIVVVAPWFMFVADVSGRVYRIGTPAWTLLPIGLALLGFGIACVIASRREVSAGRLEGSVRTWLVACVTIVWVLGLTLVFARTLASRGTSLIDLPQLAGYVRQWYPYLVTTAIGAVGLALSIPAMRAADRSQREAYEDLWLATICGLPLVILVIGVGEPPRNYLAQLAIGAGIGAGGWLWLFERAVGRGAAVPTEPATDDRPGRSLILPSVVGLLIVSLLGASTALAATIGLHRPTSASDDAVDTVAAWVGGHVVPGSTIAFGSFLGYEMALPLRTTFTVRQVRHALVVGDTRAPDGVAVSDKPRTDDWVSVDIAPRNINEFQAFSASSFIAQLRKSAVDYWVYSTGTTTSAPTIIPALEGAPGFERVAHWSFARTRGGPIETYVYRLDLDRLALDRDRIHMAPDALERMVALIENKRAFDLARRLAPQVVADPRSQATDVLLDRLRRLAGQSRARAEDPLADALIWTPRA